MNYYIFFITIFFIGILRLRRMPLPKLTNTQYVLNISAVDDNISGGSSSLISFTKVIVGINDVNNNKPIFREVSLILCNRATITVNKPVC